MGDSLTYGYGLEDREKYNYPVQLQEMLGDKSIVKNFGHSGATLLTSGHLPYISCIEYKEAIEFQADVYVICLGSNDINPGGYIKHSREFSLDYYKLIDSFRCAFPKTEIMVALIPPVYITETKQLLFIEKVITKIHDEIRQIAKDSKSFLIDLYSPLLHRPDFFIDGLHPNETGASIIAKNVYNAIMRKFD